MGEFFLKRNQQMVTGLPVNKYALKGEGGSGSGTVTSVDMSVPTGLTISGNPITTSGTLALGLDTGYIIPLQSTIDGKQDTLVSGTNIKTINGSSILGSGNLSISGVGTGTANTIAYWDTTTSIASLATATYPSLTELSYVKGVTSSIQTQLNAKGTGNVTKVGTPVDNQVGVWTGDGTIEGTTGLTYNGTTLDITLGDIDLDNTVNTNKRGIITKNGDRFIHNFNYGNNGTVTTHGNNLFLGTNAGNLTMGSTATNAYQSSYNTGIGANSLISNTTGNYNTAIGYSTLGSNTTGGSNVAIGMNTLFSNTTGYSNLALGYRAMYANTTGYQNTAYGEDSLISNTTGAFNMAQGYQSLRSNTSGIANTAIGAYALYSNTTSHYNSAFGFQALFSSTGSNNSAFGLYSLYNVTTGSNNTAVGYNTGLGITTGSNNTIIGAGVTGLSATMANNIIIADGSGNRRINVDSSGNAGVGTISPDRRFHEEVVDAVTNAVTYSQRHSHITSGTATTGFGIGEEYELENASGTNRVVGTHEFTYSNATDATEDATYKLRLIKAGTLTDAVTVDSVGNTTLAGVVKTAGYTVATLPTGVVGYRAYVTDALAPTWGATVVGGGAVVIPVFYNGTNWIVA